MFYDAGLDYVSCSPFRVPVARLAAAQAVLAGEPAGKRPADLGAVAGRLGASIAAVPSSAWAYPTRTWPRCGRRPTSWRSSVSTRR